MKTIFTVGAVVLATCLLSGCVNEQKVNQLASNVQTLNAKIARLEQDMKALRPQIYAAKSEANRANTRLVRTILIACAACVCTQNDKKIPGSMSVAGDFF
ncbi:lipoprotein YqhH [Escherichia coli]|mgnify:CR=1 FL=1|jgi:murein lipoprotein|nr:lipoprotein YqhH [Escherichia coli]MBZ8335639.1 lipoprotein YqhH [Escherichia coli]MBZ8350279.1 lipoprotein YqhH [Escherichia coli]MBZ8380283.1 lipoprotein YqhH [Escherichia coli]UIV07103.1 lipoprotein YqhH [Escherichia coli]